MSNESSHNMNASPEYVAYQLLLHVMQAEGRGIVGEGSASTRISRNVILDAYSDCLEAVRGQRSRKSAKPTA